MTNVRNRIIALGALLVASFAPPIAAEPEKGELESEQGSEPMSPDHPHYASGYYSIGFDYYEGRSSKAELEARVAAMHKNRSERRKDHQEGPKGRWGATILNHPKARDELRIHARREAFLARALFLAHTDPSVQQRASLVARIEGIIDKESVRHSAVMESFGPAPTAAPSASPASSTGGK